MAGLWRRYSKLVERFPWGTNILQTGVLCATGDVIAQFAVERRALKVGKVGRVFDEYKYFRSLSPLGLAGSS